MALTIEAVFPLRPPLPTPEGLSEEATHQFLRSISPEDAPIKEMQNYCDQDWRRFLYTWGLVRELGGNCLELGSNPYFTTFLLKRFSKLTLTLANYFGPQHPAKAVQNVRYRDLTTNLLGKEELEYHHFSVESGPFPFPSHTFDVVLFCEIMEHLQMDPIMVLKEIKRVLKDGGTLILTTPNACRLENVARMVAGANIYDQYSGYGVYGRHNREYNRHELYLMLDYCGFDFEQAFTADVYPNQAINYPQWEELVSVLKPREQDLGQYMFVRCRSTRPARTKRPSWLYRSYPEAELE